MLLAIKEKYPFRDYLMPEVKKWTAMEKGIHYLKKCAMVEMLLDPFILMFHTKSMILRQSSVHQIRGGNLQELYQKSMPVH